MSSRRTLEIPCSRCGERERWVKLEIWPGYMVSDQGRVIGSLGRVLKTALSSGYPAVKVSGRDGIQKNVRVHVLVVAGFMGERPAGKEISHKNGDKTDNRLENLEWMTHSENIKHARRTGLVSKKKLTVEAVREIRKRVENGETHRTIASRFGINQSMVSLIATRKAWRHVT